jgi:D-alanyl-lipoteichoic acid acyltransferase DltB (MBOAT superfamily)
MLFNSAIFLVFAAMFFSLWPLMRRRSNARWAYITVASFVFYGWWDWRFLFLIIGSGLLDFLSGLGMVRWPTRRKLFLVLSILGNVGSLAVFKYSHFVATNLDQFLASLGIEPFLTVNIPAFMLILPVGISFYTFQSMSYTIDIYKGHLQPTRNVLHFFAYLSMFPQLVAGPIVRAADLLPQLRTHRPTTEQQRWEGLRLIVHGFFKKVVIADNLAPVVATAFAGHYDSDGTVFWWTAVTMFAFQIYCDFSGYSNIARGLGKWMGYDFPINFNHPYTAVSFNDFWRRWHISLSTWFRDYVYIPLGGSRRGAMRYHMNMWITMLVSGLWHGAGWTFLIWGAMHAAMMSLERITGWPERLSKRRGGSVLCTLIVLAGAWAAWVMFRATTISQAGHILKRMFIWKGGELDLPDSGMLFMGILAVREAFVRAFPNYRAWRSGRVRKLLDPVTLAVMILVCVYLRGPGNEFIYFQF